MKKLMTICAAMLLVAGAAGTAAAQDQSWNDLTLETKRQEIDAMANAALQELVATSPEAKVLYEKAYGWAAFDTFKIAAVFVGGGGNGVAVAKDTGARTYMKMGTAGIGADLGAKSYQVVFLFQTKQAFESFVDNGWEATAGAGVVVGERGRAVETDFTNGVAVYPISAEGLMARADIAGSKYWKNEALTRSAAEPTAR